MQVDRFVDELVHADTPVLLGVASVAILAVPLWLIAGYTIRHRSLRGVFRRWHLVILGCPFTAFAMGAAADSNRGMPAAGVAVELALALGCAAAIGVQVARRYANRTAPE